jgi:phage baseplate assembly protein W
MTVFSDFDSLFRPHPETKDLLTLKDGNAISASIRNIVLTSKYERPFSDLGGNVHSLRFELNTPGNLLSIETAITESLNNYEPRIVVQTVSAKEKGEDVDIFIAFFNTLTQSDQTLSLVLKRVR